MKLRSYSSDLAYIHHAGFSSISLAGGREILRILKKRGLTSGTIVDLGCGSGVWAKEVVRHGYIPFGIDISPSMIRLAKKNVPRGRFVTTSVISARIPPCTAITSFGEVLNYTFDRSLSGKRFTRLFRRWYKALEPGGVLMFDILTQGKNFYHDYKSVVEGKGWTVLVDVSIDRTRWKLDRRIVSFRMIGNRWRRTEEVHRILIFDHRQILRYLQSAGFSVTVQRHYDHQKLRPGHIVFIAIKK